MMNDKHKSINLNNEDYKRYARHIIMPSINIEGQQRLKNARILFIGAGGLSASALLYLVGAGIGHIGIVDDDYIELSNLHRQIIYNQQDIGQYKGSSAKKTLKQLNSNCKIEIYLEQLNDTNAERIIKNYEVIIDSTDNFIARYILSKACHQLHKVHIYGAVAALEGQVSVFNYQGGPSYKDIYPLLERRNINECSNRGVLGVTPGMIGLIQATEAIKIITGTGTILSGQMIIYNSLNLSFRKIKLRNINPYIKQIHKLVNNNNYQKTNKNFQSLSLSHFKELRNKHYNLIYLIDIRNPIEYHLWHLQSAINIPLKKLKKKENLSLLHSVSMKYYLILYCSSEIRASIASYLLHQAHIKHWILNISSV